MKARKLTPEEWLERFWPANGAMLRGSVPGQSREAIQTAWPDRQVTHDPDRRPTGSWFFEAADGSREQLSVEPIPGEARYILELVDHDVAKAIAKLVRARLKRELGEPGEKSGKSLTWQLADRRVYFATYRSKVYPRGHEEDGAAAEAMNLVVTTNE